MPRRATRRLSTARAGISPPSADFAGRRDHLAQVTAALHLPVAMGGVDGRALDVPALVDAGVVLRDAWDGRPRDREFARFDRSRTTVTASCVGEDVPSSRVSRPLSTGKFTSDLSPTRVALALSHRGALQRALDEGRELALILEVGTGGTVSRHRRARRR